MSQAKLTFKNLTTERNGYNMPIVDVESDQNLTIINRGYNEFECTSEIDESDLEQIVSMLPEEKTAMLRIKTPSRETVCWFKINPNPFPRQSRIMW